MLASYFNDNPKCLVNNTLLSGTKQRYTDKCGA